MWHQTNPGASAEFRGKCFISHKKAIGSMHLNFQSAHLNFLQIYAFFNSFRYISHLYWSKLLAEQQRWRRQGGLRRRCNWEMNEWLGSHETGSAEHGEDCPPLYFLYPLYCREFQFSTARSTTLSPDASPTLTTPLCTSKKKRHSMVICHHWWHLHVHTSTTPPVDPSTST